EVGAEILSFLFSRGLTEGNGLKEFSLLAGGCGYHPVALPPENRFLDPSSTPPISFSLLLIFPVALRCSALLGGTTLSARVLHLAAPPTRRQGWRLAEFVPLLPEPGPKGPSQSPLEPALYRSHD